VRRQWLLQFGGHAGENARGKWGGGVGSGVPRDEGRKRERGGRRRVGMALGGVVGGWLANKGGWRGAGDAAWRDRQVGPGDNGAQCQQRGAGGRGVSEAAWRRGTERRARPAQCRVARFKLGFKPIQKYSNDLNEI
jgi:hypothetical protein